MIYWIRCFGRGLIEEIFMKSTSKDGTEVDTFFKWVIAISFFSAAYFLIFYYDENAVRFDQWCHAVLGWKLADVPSPAKVAWHRLMAGVMAGGGAFITTLIYAASVYRRIKARIGVSEAKAEQTPIEVSTSKNNKP